MKKGNGKHRWKPAPTEAIPDRPLVQPGEEIAHSVLGYDKVWFTRHALHRMKQRRVTQEEVFSVLANPTRKGLRTQPGRFRWRKRRNKNYVIDVIFERWPDKLGIITVIVIRDPL
ncbi:MAG: DUF4258 domain-containing protein [Pirellulales bacterium]|nr:DUF4258 domain-containing protein [Pirellulales bacterium]